MAEQQQAQPCPPGLAKMREPFPAHQISQLPKPTAKREVMEKLPKANCDVCGGYHATSKVIHLSYVGHAALTDRLLDADPSWNWEPLALTAEGLPKFDANGGLWIKLTVDGVTRLGYGNAEAKPYSEAGAREKEVIGDALRNAAMRFGAALDLWHKGKLHLDPEEDDEAKAEDAGPKLSKPDGYDAFAEALGEASRHGLPALREAFKKGNAAQRDYLIKHDADNYEDLKAAAEAATEAAQ